MPTKHQPPQTKDEKQKEDQREPRMEKPKKQKVVLVNTTGRYSRCNISVLREIFHMDMMVAGRHAKEAETTGQSVIAEHFEEVAIEKKQQGNDRLKQHARHNPRATESVFEISK